MSTTKVENNSPCYVNAGQHLAAQLRRLDLLIHIQVIRYRVLMGKKSGDALAGFYIGDEEVDNAVNRQETVENGPGTDIAPLLKKLEALEKEIDGSVENSLAANIHLPLLHLARSFHLAPFEVDALLVCLAPEMDTKYEKLYAYLHGDLTRKSPSVSLVLDLLCRTVQDQLDARTCFFEQSPLLKFKLLSFHPDSHGSYDPHDPHDPQLQSKPLISRSLKLDERVVRFLLRQDSLSGELAALVTVIPPGPAFSPDEMEDYPVRAVNIQQWAGEYFNNKGYDKGDGRGNGSLVFYLNGPRGTGKKRTARAFCQREELMLLTMDMKELLTCGSPRQMENILERLFRETLFHPAVIYLENADALLAEGTGESRCRKVVGGMLEMVSIIVFMSGQTTWSPSARFSGTGCCFLEISFPVPLYPRRERLWASALAGGYPPAPDVTIAALASTYRFTPGQIRDAASQAGMLALKRGSGNGTGDPIRIEMTDLYEACRAQADTRLREMARKVTPRSGWEDIVLPPDKLRQLREMCDHVKYRHRVYGEWGFGKKLSLGKGLNILFSGPSGTGKTLASEILAHALNLDFYKIDLSCVVSKYIGETEKNLAAIFKEAETANAVLFFDEADSLFGKRSEVKDAHDRYANIEINYVLQKMEEHEGVVILATNFRKNIDDAFTRRMHFCLDFPFPDEEYRLKIWETIFPRRMPMEEEIDYEFLARSFKVPGGSIKNIALNAAFLAAGEGKILAMPHIARAVRREYQKTGKLYEPTDFGKYYEPVMAGLLMEETYE
ncbi:MAG: ATP-binding protein [bacterium]|nr:ATP-binding protein [bacterium]